MKRLATILLAMVAFLAASPAAAAAPERSAVPVPRPMQIADDGRPAYLVFVRSTQGVVRSLRPVARPAGLARRVSPQIRAITEPASTRSTGVQPARSSGSGGRRICGKSAIRGEKLASIPGKLRGCGVKKPVRVLSVSGVRLSRPAVMDCQTAKALDRWIRKGVKPTVGRRGGGVAGLRVIADYSCRTRNNVPGARISEHGKGRAIDIAAILLKDGTDLEILSGWNDPVQGKLLKRIHRAACGPFGTVLGPNSDRYHRNHFHLDTARYRGGSYCR